MSEDSLGDRIKHNYEDSYRISLPRRTNVLLRIDGKAFHTYTRGLKTPFDEDLISDMQNTARFLCEKISGAKFALIQSDEISIVLTDFDKIDTQAWFDNNLQKMVSVSASLATGEFNRLRFARNINKVANFDSRAFIIPSRAEVLNYFLWRQQDMSRNSVQMVARSIFSHKECENKNSNQLQEMIFQKSGTNWNDFPVHQKRGSTIYKIPSLIKTEKGEITRNKWFIDLNSPIFSQDWSWFADKIP